ncbi:MAG: hypothetical protein IPG86_00845 [Chitinophagaceae bacterium]|nr:hypothetical protein [Chitinophagaceae bacterium]
MNCLVVAATAIEIKPFLEQLGNDSLSSKIPATDVLISGIGLTATTYSLSGQLRIKQPDLVIQAGVGGCFDPKIPLGTVLAVKQEAIADQSVIELNQLRTLFDLQLVPQDQYPYQKGWLLNKSEVLKKTRLKKVKGISVNEITTSRQKVRFTRKHFNPSLNQWKVPPCIMFA